ncbi:hypothetical protein [Desulfosporosinus nitroreducens]|uniref:Uncharacterized protein n=1 Tax=Desulfosporosinus nitroreducens TaxID=2018668 RepID=A0ABT8QMN8_9FIRM|nr:hypothetical protein [Desulfosporosinus nitroreducens]MDO0822594.1 hypothetical protein [Desulfosporosinus nitroreducens]
MDKDYKGLLKYSGLIFISVLLTSKLPRDSYSVIQYIIRPIRFEHSVLYLSGVIPLAMLFIGIKGLNKLKWFAGKSKLLIFIVVIAFVIPIMRSSVDFGKITYFRGMDNELRSIDFKDTDIKIFEIKANEATINVRLSLTDYGRDMSKFKVRMYLPDSLANYFNEDFLEFEELYKTYGHQHELNIDKKIKVQLANGTTIKDISDTDWDWDTFKYELYNDSSSTELTYHGI